MRKYSAWAILLLRICFDLRGFMKISSLLILLFSSLVFSKTGGWELLYTNKPTEALNAFRESKHGTPEEIAKAIDGEIAVLSYLGNTESLGELACQSYSLTKSPLHLAIHGNALHFWSQQPANRADKRVLKTLQKARQTGSIATSHFAELEIAKLLVHGKTKKASTVKDETGVISQWYFVGPFENSAGSGFNTVFPPELELNTDSSYIGKSRNIVSWTALHNSSPSPWIWLNNHAEGSNATYYFATTVNSAIEQDAYISLGASASFKLFHNSEPIISDSLFRNTGLNTFLKRVTITKGINTFLLKIGYEDVKANFSLALLDTNFQAPSSLTQLSEVVDQRSSTTANTDNSMIMVDSIASLLVNRIENDSTDLASVAQLISFLLLHDQGDRAETLIHTYLEKFPESGYLYSQLAGILQRRGHTTEASTLFQKAYSLSPEGNVQWQHELSRHLAENDLASAQIFLEFTPVIHKKKLSYVTAEMQIKASEGKIAQAMQLLDTIAENFSDETEAVAILHKIYAEGGQFSDAEKILLNAKKKNRYNSAIDYTLAEYYIKSGASAKALELFHDVMAKSPVEPRATFMIATLFTAHKQFEEALPYINKTLELTPNSILAHRLKGQILQQLGEYEQAEETYQEAITKTEDDFIAWESLREIQKKPSWQSLAPLPDYKDLIEKSQPWKDSIDEPVTILNYNEDIFRYPSNAIRRRTFFLIHLADRNSIEEWQEYTIGYSSGAERMTVLNVFTIKENGSTVSADRNGNHIVFKSLEPGDNILVEYTIEEHQHSGMNGMLYGEQEFSTSLPAFRQEMRLINPLENPITYTLYGNAPTPKIDTVDDFQISSFQVMKQEGDKHDSYKPREYEGRSKVSYSDFSNWNEIAQWYYHLIARKSEDNPAIRALADSLFANTKNDWEKVETAHRYITKNIAYSFVPFRQSGWIPQGTGEILATRIGDCKDMALLGRTLLRFGGVEADLVLVNTGIFSHTKDAFIGPNFDHAILSATIDDSTLFIDLTSNNSALGSLPVPDQGAMALMVTEDADSVFTLPFDTPEQREISREYIVDLHTDGSAEITATTVKSGIFATLMRNNYRFLSEKKRKSSLEEAIARGDQSVSISALEFEGLDSLRNDVRYHAKYIVDNAVSVSSNSALYRVHIPDRVQSSFFPVIENRTAPISLRQFYRGNSAQQLQITINYPDEWTLTNRFENKDLVVDDGSYQISFMYENGKIIIERKADLAFDKIYSVSDFKDEHEFLSSVLLHDNIELIFSH